MLAIGQGITADVPKTLPDYALGNAWILRGERSLAILVFLVVILTIVWRGIIEGQLPLEFGQGGLKYPDLIQKGTQPVTDAVEKAIRDVRGDFARDLGKVSQAVDATAEATADAIRQMESKIENIEEELKK